MKIGVIGSRGYPYVYSGYETLVAELSIRLVEKGHDVIVYCHKGLFNPRPESINGVSLKYVPAVESKIMSQFSHSLLATIHAVFSNCDALLFVNSANGPFGFLTKVFRKPAAINVDGLEWLRPKWHGLGSQYFYWASKMATELFDIVITDSERMADIYQKEFQCSSVTIAYGANLGYSSKPEVLSQFNLSPNMYYLVVGRLIPDNNADLIVKGFEKANTSKKLVIVGGVPYSDAYADRIRTTRDDRIIFTGYVKDQDLLCELYCNAFAYFHGHEFGGTNPALLKALACGSCVLALDTVFSREVLCDGTYGLFFSKDPSAVTALVEQVESGSTIVETLRSRSRDRITMNYTWSKIANQYEELFYSIIKR